MLNIDENDVDLNLENVLKYKKFNRLEIGWIDIIVGIVVLLMNNVTSIRFFFVLIIMIFAWTTVVSK